MAAGMSFRQRAIVTAFYLLLLGVGNYGILDSEDDSIPRIFRGMVA
jgi:hypothetical protein